MTSNPTVIVCERSGKWSAALRRHLPAGTRLRETRALTECAAELDSVATSFVVVEMTETNVARVLAFLADLMRRFPRAAAIVVAAHELAQHEWLAREAGALHFDVSTRAGAAWARLAENHFERTPVELSPLGALVGQTLPWEEI